jgi:hypothetical protein
MCISNLVELELNQSASTIELVASREEKKSRANLSRNRKRHRKKGGGIEPYRNQNDREQ